MEKSFVVGGASNVWPRVGDDININVGDGYNLWGRCSSPRGVSEVIAPPSSGPLSGEVYAEKGDSGKVVSVDIRGGNIFAEVKFHKAALIIGKFSIESKGGWFLLNRDDGEQFIFEGIPLGGASIYSVIDGNSSGVHIDKSVSKPFKRACAWADVFYRNEHGEGVWPEPSDSDIRMYVGES